MLVHLDDARAVRLGVLRHELHYLFSSIAVTLFPLISLLIPFLQTIHNACPPSEQLHQSNLITILLIVPLVCSKAFSPRHHNVFTALALSVTAATAESAWSMVDGIRRNGVSEDIWKQNFVKAKWGVADM